jgi:glucans biosynthesis protein
LLLAAALAVAPRPDRVSAAERFDLETVAARARALAAEPYEESQRVPAWARELSYDEWRDIRFRPERALWRREGLPFQVHLFHPGRYYDRPVALNIVDMQGVHPVPFESTWFDYGSRAEPRPEGLGYAGFRLHYPINQPDYHDEAIVFLGATYFRSLGREQGFGLSARGLAVDTALASGEEFPWFREFWLMRPARQHEAMTVYALLDSPALAGAYRFAVHPGQRTVVHVEARLYRRRAVAKLGIAPLTSMFWRGENTQRAFVDYRPEIHDSDGLLVGAGSGEWIWRPLDNPERLQVTSFEVENPRGFGLLQRDRAFDHYQDLETHPERRPSAWVAPRGRWGPGRVELVLIPTDDETNDNVVAYFVPDHVPPLEQPLSFAYDLFWYGDDAARPPGGRCIATRRDAGTHLDAQRLVLDFAEGKLSQLPPDAPVRGVVSLVPPSEGELLEVQSFPNPETRGWRLVFQVRPRGDDALELRAHLALGDEALTETWSSVLAP